METVSLTMYIISYISHSIKSSLTYALLLRFFVFLKESFLSSRLYSLLERFAGFISRAYDASFLKTYIMSESSVQSAYSKSYLASILSWIYSTLSIIPYKLWKFIKRLSDGSLTAYVISFFSGKIIFCFSSCVALFACLMIICPHEVWNNLYAVVAAFGFLAYYMASSHGRERDIDFKSEGFGLIAFILFASLSVLYAYDKIDALRIVLFLMSAIILGMLMKNSIDSEKKLIYVLKIISIGAFVTSVIGIIQRFMGVEVNPEYVDIVANSSMPGRVFSTFGNPNNFAELLVLTMPATAVLVFALRPLRQKLLYFAFLLIDFVAIAMSYSRSCWVALLIAAVVMLLIYDWRLIVPCVFVGIIAIPFLPESITDRILTIGSMKDTSNASRYIIWRGAWKMIENYFVSGVGAGPLTFAKYYLPLADHWALTAPHSHMVYMELIIEFGIFAFIGFMMYMVYTIKRALASLANAGKTIKATIAAIVGSMCGMAFVFGVEYVWFYPRVMFMFWIMLGILSAVSKKLKGN